MTPEQLVNYLAQKNAAASLRREPIPEGWMIAVQEIRAEDRAEQEKARLAHERELGLPKALDGWCNAKDAIAEDAARERAETEQRHASALAEIGERERVKLARLGPEPTAQLLEQQIATTRSE